MVSRFLCFRVLIFQAILFKNESIIIVEIVQILVDCVTLLTKRYYIFKFDQLGFDIFLTAIVNQYQINLLCPQFISDQFRYSQIWQIYNTVNFSQNSRKFSSFILKSGKPKMKQETSYNEIQDLIQDFKYAIKNYYKEKAHRPFKNNSIVTDYYEKAKKAETQQRNLKKALKYYLKAIENKQRKDSAIKDFASSVHQLGFTQEAIRLMDYCEGFYDGDIKKYRRLRDNFEIQLKPTGKHNCKYLLIEGLSDELQSYQSETLLCNALFRVPKRIIGVSYYQSLNFLTPLEGFKKGAKYVLFQFQSFSAAKKTLQSFVFQEWFALNLYWIDCTSMKIFCSAHDGKREFQDKYFVDNEIVNKLLSSSQSHLWISYGLQEQKNRTQNGIYNLMAIRAIQENISKRQGQKDKENLIPKVEDSVNQTYEGNYFNQYTENNSYYIVQGGINWQSQQKQWFF